MKRIILVRATLLVLVMTSNAGICAELSLVLGPEELVEANGVDIVVPDYSVPSFVDWNNDNLNGCNVGRNYCAFIVSMNHYKRANESP